MAIYQFVIELIPSELVNEKKEKAIELLYSKNEYEMNLYEPSVAWKNNTKKKLVFFLISNILPEKKSWNKNLQTWGDEEHNDIQIWTENGEIESIKFRFDLRTNTETLRKLLILFSKNVSCHLFIPSMKKIIQPDIELLNQLISASSAEEFFENPKKFLEKVRSKKNKLNK